MITGSDMNILIIKLVHLLGVPLDCSFCNYVSLWVKDTYKTDERWQT